MATPFATASAAGTPVPATKEFTAAWIAYVLFAFGALFWWPALLGLVICYSKRGHADAGFIGSHHGWLIRTFWWSLVGYAICLGLAIASVWPFVADVVRQVVASGGDWTDDAKISVNVDWGTIFTSVGSATLGGLGIVAVWIWYVYRVLRGMLALNDARPLP
jgi:uncharacterized membrane protein